MKSLAFVLAVVAIHVGVASIAASRHLLRADVSIPQLACEADR
ncbi:MAG: hypothetical protein ABFS41_02030 [Myxococcota bacterium]